jgi:hypothetical protein
MFARSVFVGGNGVGGCQCHYFLVEQWGIHYMIDLVPAAEGEETNASSWGECCKDALSHHCVVLVCPLLELCPSRFAEGLALGSEWGDVDLTVLVDDVDGCTVSIDEMGDLLRSGQPSHLGAFCLQLGDVNHRAA